MVKPLVSVCMITYNHENFLAQAIEGVLMQEVDFEVELIIADDCSNDNTEDIIKYYIKSHPKGHWIRYTRHEKNLGMMPNFLWSIGCAKGEFVALCEGDDYWLNPQKLSIQIKFLKGNPKFMFSFHDAFYLKNEIKILSFSEKYSLLNRESHVFSIKDLEKYKWFIPTCSLVFRNFDFPKWLERSSIGDFSLQLILSERGDFYFHNMVSGVYRIHKNGVSNYINTYSNRLNDITLWFWNVKMLNKFVLIRWYFSVLWRFVFYKFFKLKV